MKDVRSHVTKNIVILSGLPASGKTTLGRRLAHELGLPVIDKDDILERLFESSGTGDAAWRRTLSREADDAFRSQASALGSAVLVSFWHVPGMAVDSGTPTEWLRGPSNVVVNVRCLCTPEVAASRFWSRARHAGHGDEPGNYESALESVQALAKLGPLELGHAIDVDTSTKPSVLESAHEVRAIFNTGR